MKSERRHELETNELAVRLQDAFEKVNPYLGQIFGLIAAIAVFSLVWTYWTSSSSVAEGEAWEEFMLASYSSDRELTEMKRLAENEAYQGTGVAEWAYLTWSDRQLLLASTDYLVSRASAMSRLETIEKVYSNLATAASDPILKNRAQFGLAQVYEMQGKVDEAQLAYKNVTGDLAMLAAERAKQLEDADVESAINWLAKAELPKLNLPDSSSMGGTRPSFEADIPLGTSSTENVPVDKSIEELLAPGGTDVDRYNESAAEQGDSSVEGEDSNADSAEVEEVSDATVPEEESSAPTLE